jgi:hypothetical protein
MQAIEYATLLLKQTEGLSSMYSPPIHEQPAAARMRGSTAKPLPVKMPPWGWLEWFGVVLTAIQFLLFVPGVGAFRVLTRVASMGLALVAWFWVWRSGRRPPPGKVFPATPWLIACSVWLGLSIFHPTTNSLLSGTAQAAMYIAVLSPVFWVPSTLVDSRQIPRLMKIGFASCVLGTLLGLGQVYRPETFNPPYIPAIHDGNDYSISSLTFVTSDGRTIIRPCGLSDNPGSAAGAGALACLIGLSMAVRPMNLFKRAACIGVAFAGMAVIYYCQMRTTMVMEFVCIIGLVVLFALRGHLRQAVLLGVGSMVLLIGAAGWVVSTVGDIGTKRFFTLIEERPDELYHSARGNYVQEAFEKYIWEMPLGGGLGRWGQAYGNFGDHRGGFQSSSGQVWVEVQWPAWIVDGGIPLTIFYVTAIVVSMFDTLRVALTCKDKELSYWTAVIFTQNLAIVANVFSACPFVSQTGVSFWMGAVMVHAADRLSRSASSQQARGARRFS